jgi:hypothetical protein
MSCRWQKVQMPVSDCFMSRFVDDLHLPKLAGLMTMLLPPSYVLSASAHVYRFAALTHCLMMWNMRRLPAEEQGDQRRVTLTMWNWVLVSASSCCYCASVWWGPWHFQQIALGEGLHGSSYTNRTLLLQINSKLHFYYIVCLTLMSNIYKLFSGATKGGLEGSWAPPEQNWVALHFVQIRILFIGEG